MLSLTAYFLLALAVTGAVMGMSRLRRRRPHGWLLLAAGAALALLGAGLLGWQERRDEQASLALHQGLGGELVQVATRVGFERDARRTARRDEARRLFAEGERALQAHRYREAAEAFYHSTEAAPTAAAFLDLGVARAFLHEFMEAEQASRSAARLAKASENLSVEAAALDALGRALGADGRSDTPLHSHRTALELHVRAGDPIGRAIAHAELGEVHRREGKLAEAVLELREAFALYTRIKHRLGRAHALAGLAELYLETRRPAEALTDLREALDLDRAIDNVVGQVRDLRLLARAYSMQAREAQAQECLAAANALQSQEPRPEGQCRVPGAECQ